MTAAQSGVERRGVALAGQVFPFSLGLWLRSGQLWPLQQPGKWKTEGIFQVPCV